MFTQYALKANKIYIPSATATVTEQNIIHFLPAIQVGYIPSKRATDAILTMLPEDAKLVGREFSQEVLSMLGVNVNWRTLWPSYESLQRAGQSAYVVAMIHYLTTETVDMAMPVARVPLDYTPSRVVKLEPVNKLDLIHIVKEKVAKLASLNEADYQFIGSIFDEAKVASWLVYSREVAMRLAVMLDDYYGKPTGLSTFGRVPSDALRYAAWISGFNPTELGKHRFKSLRRTVRRAIADFLNREGVQWDGSYRNEWNALFNLLHVGDLTGYEVVKRFRSDVYRNIAHRVPHIDNLNVKLADRLTHATPGQVVRRALSLARATARSSKLRSRMATKLGGASINQLLALWAHCQSNLEYGLAIIPKDSHSKQYAYKRHTDIGDQLEAFSLVDQAIKARLTTGAEIGKVCLDPMLNGVTYPLTARELNGSLGYPRGSWFPLQRDFSFGIHWQNTKANDRVDLDLSYIGYSEQLTCLGLVSWHSLFGGRAAHSGDLTNGENGVSEFIRPKQQDAYSAAIVNSFTGQRFSEIPHKFIVLNGSYQGFGRDIYYDPTAVVMQVGLPPEATVAIPIITDQRAGRVIVADVAWLSTIRAAAKVRRNILQFLGAIINRHYLSCADVLGLLQSVDRVQLVDSESEADVICRSWQDVVALPLY